MCLVCLVAPLPVSGQSYHSFSWEINRIQQVTKWKMGPFRIYPVVNFRNIGYDNNVYRQREEDSPIADFTATISPVVNTYVIIKNLVILDFSVNPEYVYYAKTEREKSFNLNYSTGFKFNLLHRFVLSGDFLYDKTRRRANSEFDIRANQILKDVTGSLFYETGRETSFGVTGLIRKVEYEDELAPGEEIYYSRTLNRKQTSIHGEFYYRLRPEVFFFLTGGYTDYKFDFEESRWRDSYSYQALTGVRFPILGDIRGTISVGYKKLTPRAGIKKHFAGPIGQTDVEARIKRFIFRGRLSKDAHISYWTNNAFFVEYIYGAGLSYYFTQFLRLDYDFSYGDNQYPEKTLIRLPDESYEEIQRRDKYQSHRVGTVFRIFQNTGVGLTLDFWERKSNDYRWGKRSSVFVGGYVTYDF